MAPSDFETIAQCRACGSRGLVDILDLGRQPLANALVKSGTEEVKKFPLTTAFCPKCSLFQLKETIRKEILFDNYFWVTGTSLAAKEYSKVFFERVRAHCGLKPGDFIVEMASNDGTILKQFVAGGYKTLGVEPARNIAQIAVDAGVPTLCDYWNKTTARKVTAEHGCAKVVIARNVIPHVSELHEVIEGIGLAIGEDGTGIIEFHDGGIILRELHYDSIYHEHLCYFTVKSMTGLLNHYGLHPFRIDPSPISGGSHVIYFTKNKRVPDVSYVQAMKQEELSGVNDLSAWRNFAARAFDHKARTLERVALFKGKTIVGFGASARSSTYLNFCELTVRDIKAVIDNNPLKQGLFTAGSRIPIVSRDKGLALNPDVIFVLAWNLKEEIMRECRIAGFRGVFLVPFPGQPYLVASLKEENVS